MVNIFQQCRINYEFNNNIHPLQLIDLKSWYFYRILKSMATHESRNNRIFAPAINEGVTNALKTFFFARYWKWFQLSIYKTPSCAFFYCQHVVSLSLVLRFLSLSFLFSLHYNSQCFYHFYIEHIYNLPCAFLCGPISDFSTFHCFLRCSEFNYSFDRNDLNWMSTSFRIFDSFPIRHFHLLLLLWFFLYICLFFFFK